MSNKIVLSKQFNNIVTEISNQILKEIQDDKECYFIGIRTRGVYFAQRIISKLSLIKSEIKSHLGILDINLYRDDLNTKTGHPEIHETGIDFDITDKKIFLVDDVLYTGRTIRCALNELSDFGRPCFIRLIVFVDRGGRELPIQPDYTGIKIKSKLEDMIKVHFKEIDMQDEIIII